MERLIVVDACLTGKIASILRKRGRRSESTKQLGHRGHIEDPDLIPELARQLRDTEWVLLTDDDKMPTEWGDILSENDVTLATINGKRPPDEEDRQEEWRWDTAMRWAHVMGEQAQGTWRRYSPSTHGLWTPRGIA